MISPRGLEYAQASIEQDKAELQSEHRCMYCTHAVQVSAICPKHKRRSAVHRIYIIHYSDWPAGAER
jgi:hypothetical protein